MRKRKYRAWSEMRKKMYYNIWFDNEWIYGYDHDVDDYVIVGALKENNQLSLEKLIMMDWLGILDENRREIYEEDVMEYRSYDTRTGLPQRNVFVVEWDNDLCGFPLCYAGEKRYVIGNIFENPEYAIYSDYFQSLEVGNETN